MDKIACCGNNRSATHYQSESEYCDLETFVAECYRRCKNSFIDICTKIMDHVRKPFLTNEMVQTQRVDVYVEDLKERIKKLRQVSNESFETERNLVPVKKPLDIEPKVRQLVQNFERMNEQGVSAQRLAYFKRTRAAFEKPPEYDLNNSNSNSANKCQNDNNKNNSGSLANTIRNKNNNDNNNNNNNHNSNNNNNTTTNTTTNTTSNSNNKVDPTSFKEKIRMFNDIGTTYRDDCRLTPVVREVNSMPEVNERLSCTSTVSCSNSADFSCSADNDDSDYNVFVRPRENYKSLPPNNY